MPMAMLSAALLAAACTSDEPSPTARVTPTRAPPATAPETPARTPTPTAAPAAAGAWERVADAPMQLTEVAAAAHDGRLWVAGGLRADGSASDAVLVYDPAADRWSDGPPLPAGVHHAALVSNGERLFLLGGYRGGGFDDPTDEAWVLDEETEGWQAATSLPEPRAAGAAAWDGERIVFAGGVGPSGVAGDIYAFVEDAWEPLGQMSEPREHLAAASDGAGRTWLLGGRRGGMETNTGRVELVEGSDVRLLGEELTPRGGVAAFWLGSTGACLVGGEAPGGTLADVECITADGEATELPALEVPRHGLGVAVLDGAVYAALGGEEPGLFVSAVVERLPLE
jgi:hypothetical protein